MVYARQLILTKKRDPSRIDIDSMDIDYQNNCAEGEGKGAAVTGALDNRGSLKDRKNLPLSSPALSSLSHVASVPARLRFSKMIC